MTEMKRGRLTIALGAPMELSEDIGQEISEPTEEQRLVVQLVGPTVKAYVNATQDLLQGKYAHIRDLVPIHLSDPGNVLVVACLDGIVVRFERKVSGRRIFCGFTNESLANMAAGLSENLVHCYADRNYTSTIPTTGPELKLFTVDAATKVQQDILSIRAGIDAVIEKPPLLPAPPHKPFCLVSVRNSFELDLHGVMVDADAKSFEQGQKFIARTKLRFPFGWECIEIYPFVDFQHWRPEYAPFWAENDLLASAVTQQFRDSYYQQLDPNAAARRQFASLLKSYQDLLDSNPDREEVLQSFLSEHSNLLCPEQIRVWPKLKLGKHVTDFVFREAPGDYLLVELEKSTHSLFLKNGDLSRELNHAQSQISDWTRYIEDNLSTVQRELGLSGISASPKRLVVIGRSKGLSGENRRKLQSIQDSSHKLKVMTYDDVYGNAKAVVENLLGPIEDPGGTSQIYYLPKGSSSLAIPNNAKAASHDINVTLGEQL